MEKQRCFIHYIKKRYPSTPLRKVHSSCAINKPEDIPGGYLFRAFSESKYRLQIYFSYHVMNVIHRKLDKILLSLKFNWSLTFSSLILCGLVVCYVVYLFSHICHEYHSSHSLTSSLACFSLYRSLPVTLTRIA